MSYQGRIDEAALAVFARVQAGEQLTGRLCRQVITEQGSTARAEPVLFMVTEWLRDLDSTARLAQR